MARAKGGLIIAVAGRGRRCLNVRFICAARSRNIRVPRHDVCKYIFIEYVIYT